jgi:hypothetical protein
VTRHKTRALDKLTRRIESLDSRDIDQLYGLEPVYEPDAARRGPRGVHTLHPEEFVAFQCPWCGERLETKVDLVGGDREYIEDCQVCCRPIDFTVELSEEGGLLSVKVRRLD